MKQIVVPERFKAGVNLALGGGAAKGLCIWVSSNNLRRRKIPIKAVAGTSIGDQALDGQRQRSIRFDELEFPLTITATDAHTGEEAVGGRSPCLGLALTAYCDASDFNGMNVVRAQILGPFDAKDVASSSRALAQKIVWRERTAAFQAEVGADFFKDTTAQIP